MSDYRKPMTQAEHTHTVPGRNKRQYLLVPFFLLHFSVTNSKQGIPFLFRLTEYSICRLIMLNKSFQNFHFPLTSFAQLFLLVPVQQYLVLFCFCSHTAPSFFFQFLYSTWFCFLFPYSTQFFLLVPVEYLVFFFSP